MLDYRKVQRTFKVLCMKGRGSFDDFGIDVPNLAQQFLTRLGEIDSRFGNEIALFEPKRDENHLEGSYYVGVLVFGTPLAVPDGMEYIELSQTYVSTRGDMNNISNLHTCLLKWLNEQGFKRDLGSLIAEIYHPLENGEEHVEIYLPIHI